MSEKNEPGPEPCPLPDRQAVVRATMARTGYLPGDVFQIGPTFGRPGWVGLLVMTEEVRTWGIQGFVAVPDDKDGFQQRAYVRLTWDQVVPVGVAALVPKDFSPKGHFIPPEARPGPGRGVAWTIADLWRDRQDLLEGVRRFLAASVDWKKSHDAQGPGSAAFQAGEEQTGAALRDLSETLVRIESSIEQHP